MKRLVIHIGIEKTGTTSLQQFLYANERVLADRGVGLLHCAGSPNNRQVARYAEPSEAQSPRSWRQRPVPEGQTWRQLLRQQLHDEVRAMPVSMHSVLVTSEHLHSRLHRLEDVRRVAELFEGLFDRIDIVAYLRRQDRLAVSLFSTALRAGWPLTSPLPKGVSGRMHYYNFAEMLDRWCSVFGEEHVCVRAFDRQRFAGGDLYADFLHACGWPDLCGKLELPPAQNEALPATAATALMQLNRVVHSMAGDKESPAGMRLRKALADELTTRFPGPGLMPARADARSFMQHFSESNQEVSERWFAGQPLFDEDFAAYPEQVSETNLPPAVLAETLNTLVKYMQRGLHSSTTSATDLGGGLRDMPSDLHAPRLLRVLAQKLRPAAPALSDRLKEISRSLRNTN